MHTTEVKDKKVIYLDSGDWVESLTALEYKWGRWSIYEYEEADYANLKPQEISDNEEDELEELSVKPETMVHLMMSQSSRR